MATYSNDWIGLDRGHEGIWSPAIWAGVIQAVYDCGGTVDCSDFNSLFYQKLSADFPSVTWSSNDKAGAGRSLFRDAREPWAATQALSFVENRISVTELGLSVVQGEVSYGEALIETFKSYTESGTSDNPFSIICECMLMLPTGDSLSIEDVIKIMRHYRPGGSDDLSDVLAGEVENVSSVTERRLKNIMTLLAFSGAVLVIGKEYYLASRAVAEEIVGKTSVKRLKTVKAPIGEGVYQRITYGAPGTGKSWGIEEIVKQFPDNVVRTTFHPDCDYSTFVGAYKPTMAEVPRTYVNEGVEKDVVDGNGKPVVEKKIVYDFVEQAFTKAYVKAWRAQAAATESAEAVYLVIEEINRGNCAQVFGDIFQLLDRDAEGYSKYPVDADADLQRHLAKAFGGPLGDRPLPPEVASGKKLVLPPNLRIWATMNTSDQSLFPMDSAFKRRWDWEYVPIVEGTDKTTGKRLGWEIDVKDGENVTRYDWWAFLEAVNDKIFQLTDSEDKKLGYFFAKPDGEDPVSHTGTISAKTFVGKVVFYLWNDVYKDYGIAEIFKGEQNGETAEDKKVKGVAYQAFYDKDGKSVNAATLKNFFKAVGVEPVKKPEVGE